MEFRLVQRDHPHPGVVNLGLSPQDPYLQACWRPLLDPWTTRIVTEVAGLTADGDCTLPFDALSSRLNPSRAHPTSVTKDREIRARTIFTAMEQVRTSGLGFVELHGPSNGTFGVYRQIPLVAEADLRRLNDPELFAHAGAVEDINHRLIAAGRPPLSPPNWLADRLGRGDPTVRPNEPTVAAIGQARLDALRHPQLPATPAASL